MKYFSLVLIIVSSLLACKPTMYSGHYNQLNQTQVQLNQANFNVLGSFRGIASSKKFGLNVKDKVGLVAKAKQELLQKAKEAGIELKGSRTLINVTVDVVENANRATATVSAEIIEFK